ncbi:YHYH protein [Ramlibacter sp. PS4R-6]|uniref:YHYH protein n=1 Tax=Ramlibacter sp. PS4R-6 TaxID=3133438 RepID=UPI0030AA7538
MDAIRRSTFIACLALAGCGGGDGLVAQSPRAPSTTPLNGVVTFSGNRTNYTLTRTSAGFVVKDNVGTEGTNTITGASSLNFTDYSVNLAIGDKSQTLATADLQLLIELYVAFFNRVPDADGLSYWIDQFKAGMSIDTIADNFYGAAVQFSSVTGYSATMTNADFVRIIYSNVLGRSGATAPPDADVNFWAGELANGNETRGSLIRRMLGSAHTFKGDATWGWVANLLDNKYSVGLYFAVQQGLNFNTSNDNITRGAAIAAAVTSTDTAAARTLVGVNDTTFTTSVSVPGAPTIGTATAGDGTASIAFTAPASDGGAAITGYTVTCTGGSVARTGTGAASPVGVLGMTNATSYSCSVKATNSAGTGAASGIVSVTPLAANSTAAVYCSFSQSVTNPTIHITSTVNITCSATLRMISGNGVPDHAVGAFPNAGNPNSIGSVNVQYSHTLTPVSNGAATVMQHKIGYANNSVPFDPATAESYQNAGVWRIEALNQTYFPFGVDSNNAHVQPDGAYHYHGMPENYITRLGKGTSTMTLVGFAADGFPIYARYGFQTATNASSGVKVMSSSYRKKTTPNPGRPSTAMVPMGTFTQDYEYVLGLGDLDQCNGRYGVTPEFPNGIYHYYITDGYPYIQRCVMGTPSYNGTLQP